MSEQGPPWNRTETNSSQAFDVVVSSVAYHESITDLMACLRTTGIPDIRTDWAPLFRGQASFTTFTHQQWVQYVRGQPGLPVWCKDWLEYVADRYGM
jgi:hypothetical protein